MKRGVLFVGLAFLVAGCGSTPSQVQAKQEEPLPPPPPFSANYAMKPVKAGRVSEPVGYHLLQHLLKESPDQNHCISPVSLQIAAGMIRSAASPSADALLAKAFGQQGVTGAEAVDQAKALMTASKHFQQVGVLQSANRLWLSPVAEPEPAWLKLMKDDLKSDPAIANLAAPATLQEINAWVDQQTKGRIPKLLEGPLDEYTMAVLVNVLALDDRWRNPMQSHGEKSFTNSKGEVKQVSFMASKMQTGGSLPDETLVAEVVFRSGLELRLALPKEGRKAAELLAGKGPQNWLESDLRDTVGSLYMPKWSVRTRVDLREAWTAMGAEGLFEDGSDMLPRIGEKIWLDKAVHEVFFDLDERGVRAAAATGISVKAASAMPVATVQEITLDRPFVYAIREPRSGAILFLGIVQDLP